MIIVVVSFVLTICDTTSNSIKKERNKAFGGETHYSAAIRRKKEYESKEQVNICNVFFDLNGGEDINDSFVYTISIEKGEKIVKPDVSMLSKYNSSFDSWKDSNGRKWNFEEDKVESDMTLYAEWNWDCTILINDWSRPWQYDISKYYETRYFKSSDWRMTKKSITIDGDGFIPIEMQGKDGSTDTLFAESEIKRALEITGLPSSYGGCGPIAMMGILDGFSRYKGYSSIMNNPYKSNDRVALACDVLKNTATFEVGFENKKSGGEKSTLTLPSSYVNGFNRLMEMYNLNNQIKAEQGSIFTQKRKIKESIDKGIPVTTYDGTSKKGYFAGHYVNVYGYREYTGHDRFGNILNKTIYSARLNWGWGQTGEFFVDSDYIGGLINGCILYNVIDENKLIKPVDFASSFVNENGQGQYYFYEKEASISTSDGFSFGTSRLRCGYIENEYLVLSANRKGAGEAYLEMNFDKEIKAINFDISLWSRLEGLGVGTDTVKLLYKNNGRYVEGINFNLLELSSLKQNPTNYYFRFPTTTSSIKFEVIDKNPSGDRNKGRVVIGDMNLFY